MRIPRPLQLLAAAIGLSGCVGYVGTQPVAYGAAPPPPAVQAGYYSYYQDRPAVYVGGAPYFIVRDPHLGFGWWGPGHRWYAAPEHWHARLRAERW